MLKKIARGIVRPGSSISSALVAIASKPKKVMKTSALVTPMSRRSANPCEFAASEVMMTSVSNAWRPP